MRLLRVVPWLALPVALLAASCRDPTQITVRITTDLACNATPGGLAKAWVASAGSEVEATTCTPRTPYNYVGTLVIVPGPSGDDAKVDVTVVGSVNVTSNETCITQKKNAGDCLVVHRRLSFIPHTSLDLPIRLDSRCLNVQCKDNETCIDGLCKSIDVEPPGVDAGLDADVPGDAPADAPPRPPLHATALFAGGDSTCAVTTGGTVVCWGDDAEGHLFGGLAPSIPPTVTTLLAGATSIALGATHGCATFLSGVQCWGDNAAYQLGTGTKVTRSDTPVPVAGAVDALGTTVKVKTWGPVSAGDAFTCAAVVTGNGPDVACWGKDGFGQASGKGVPTADSVAIPTLLGVAGAIGAPVAGPDFACTAIKVPQCLSNCTYASCWGANAHGQCGVAAAASTTPTALRSMTFESPTLWAGGAHVVAGNGVETFGWGRNTEQQVATAKVDPFLPGPIVELSKHFALGAASTCWVTLPGTVSCRGAGEVVTTPQALTGVTDIVGGKNHVCALLADQTVQCWGRNDVGQLGSGGPKELGPRVVPAP